MSTRAGDLPDRFADTARASLRKEAQKGLVCKQAAAARQPQEVVVDLEEAVGAPLLDGSREPMHRILAEHGGEDPAAGAFHASQPQRDGLEGACGLRQVLRSGYGELPGLHVREVAIEIARVPGAGGLAVIGVGAGTDTGVRPSRPVGRVVARLAPRPRPGAELVVGVSG